MTTRPDLLPDDSVESFTAWPLVAAIGFAKLATLIVVVAVSLDRQSLAIIGATAGPWLAVGFALLATPVVFHVRLRRVRRRRLALICAEWDRDDGSIASPDRPAICQNAAPRSR